MFVNLQRALGKLLHWFSTNHFTPNTGKGYHLTISETPIDTHIHHAKIFNEEIVQLLGLNTAGTVISDFQENTFFKKVKSESESITLLQECAIT